MKSVIKFAIISIFCTACFKEPNEIDVTPRILLDEDFLAYFFFPKDSYWIYKDTLTNKLDSSYVMRAERGFTYGGRSFKESTKTEYVGFDLKILGIDCIGGASVYGPEKKLTYASSYTFYGQSSIFKTFKYAHYRKDTLDIYDDGPYLAATYDTLVVQGTPHLNVQKYTYLYQAIPGYKVKSTYYAKHVGIIRQEMYDGTVWDLVRYHISKF